ncbi:hypothetical protein AGLY_004759 [Aphis glycines]|uniref:Reverse transcriptase domain-containing protein n=1 Tax=Aphis glycines TaxID=307491 RepID=A0A6G0TVQ1_APHGL|nr:hypothetical protein AGLY_004759 [Aphis glycines]
MTTLCMDKTRCKIKFNQHMSNEFEVKTGLRQGDALFSVLFNIALQTVVKKTKSKYDGLNLEENIRKCGIIAYADDIIILRTNKQEVIIGTKELIKNIAVLQYRRIAWAGHVWRSNSLMKEVLKWKPLEKRPLGRPKQRLIDKVKKTLEEFGIQDMEAVAQDLDRWKQICVAVMGLNGL